MADIFFSYTGKKEHRRHWADSGEATQAEVRKTAVGLLLDIRERFPTAAVWIETRRIQVTDAEEEAYYAHVKEILAREALAREKAERQEEFRSPEEVGEELDQILDDERADKQARLREIAKTVQRPKKRPRPGGKRLRLKGAKQCVLE